MTAAGGRVTALLVALLETVTPVDINFLLIFFVIVLAIGLFLWFERAQKKKQREYAERVARTKQPDGQRRLWIYQNAPHFAETQAALNQRRKLYAQMNLDYYVDRLHESVSKWTVTKPITGPCINEPELEYMRQADGEWFTRQSKVLADARKRELAIGYERAEAELKEKREREAREREFAARLAAEQKAEREALDEFRYRLALVGITDPAEVAERFEAAKRAAPGAATGRIDSLNVK